MGCSYFLLFPFRSICTLLTARLAFAFATSAARRSRSSSTRASSCCGIRGNSADRRRAPIRDARRARARPASRRRRQRDSAGPRLPGKSAGSAASPADLWRCVVARVWNGSMYGLRSTRMSRSASQTHRFAEIAQHRQPGHFPGSNRASGIAPLTYSSAAFVGHSIRRRRSGSQK